jgi:Ca-activated chloride channel family protein
MVGSLWMSPVYAWQWQAVWKTQDQRAKIMMDAGNYAKAADMFQRRDWRATAAFRAGDTERAAREYAQLGTADGHYNAGNALAQMGHYQQAIAQYDQALALNAQHEDAAYNRRLVQAMLDQQKSRDKQQQDKQQTKPSEEKGKGKPNSASSQQNPKDTSQQQSSASPEKKPDSENPSSPKKTDSEKASEPSNQNVKQPQQLKKAPTTRAEREQQKANEQWLQLIPDDPGGLLREKFKRDHLKKQGEWQS